MLLRMGTLFILIVKLSDIKFLIILLDVLITFVVIFLLVFVTMFFCTNGVFQTFQLLKQYK
jgi:hypothetical protein